MSFFFICVLALVAGYFVYGKVVERVFVIQPERPTPCCEYRDDCDFIPMPTWKVYFIQLLDIAGLGPIFGPILGALYGPSALLWIVIGCIFAGGVHDYMSGMLSVRSKGQSIPEVVGNFMGMSARQVMRVFSVILLLLVGVVFVLGPAKLLGQMLGVNVQLLVGIIFLYYFLATILPISTLIGRLYPIFGALLLFMSVGVVVAMAVSGYELPSLSFATNTHPGDQPIWPLLFITLSCGAISGFHSTQSPLMARCIQREDRGRLVFYGAMIVEGIIALIWATVGLAFYDNPEAMQAVISAGSPAAVVNEVCNSLLGTVGGFLAILGVVVLPITSGDTAFRSTRLILADAFKIPQVQAGKRLLIAVPLFVIAFLISTQDFAIIWRYFGWSNQTLATLVLWASAIYFVQNRRFHWIATIPAMFMTAVVVSFILQAPIGLNLPPALSNGIGVGAALAAGVGFLIYAGRCCSGPVTDSAS
ncbi:carbon starvation protein A [Oceanidesulfovibrio indonesiensis]|uniref:Carbon starvation protein A n=1 Tax=Oceanidesulfovibrio indonesiensis TaxID=54767 RepID=A0A7M3MHJ0_9BACT|nr:carbon starvation protein A [Oceanidesulfovibrio indonesiensis]TVM18475.1 carbon starvation protein A [Oceanidesulfovibrio indonesiensis]